MEKKYILRWDYNLVIRFVLTCVLKIKKFDVQDNYIFTPRVFITIYDDIHCDNRVSSIGILNKSNYF